MDVARILNQQFACDICHVQGRWVREHRPVTRRYSTIHWLQCMNCGERIVAKTSSSLALSEDTDAGLRSEHALLSELQCTFPQDERYGTLLPLGYLDSVGRAIMVTRRFQGTDLAHYTRALNAGELPVVFRSAGIWLRRLHSCGGVGVPDRILGTQEKVEDLLNAYGKVLLRDRKTRVTCELLEREGPSVDGPETCAVRIHGDFKPQNLLCDGARYVGLDIHWESTGSATYDLAPFLNHVWLMGAAWSGHSVRHRYKIAEAEFLSGYGGVTNLRELRWVQLYFALCYLGQYRGRGWLAARYADWRLLPLVRNLAIELSFNRTALPGWTRRK